MTWILIFYLSGHMAGGPAAASPFSSAEACEAAAIEVKAAFPGRYEGHVCVQGR